jgi:hypothetical protein
VPLHFLLRLLALDRQQDSPRPHDRKAPVCQLVERRNRAAGHHVDRTDRFTNRGVFRPPAHDADVESQFVDDFAEEVDPPQHRLHEGDA